MKTTMTIALAVAAPLIAGQAMAASAAATTPTAKSAPAAKAAPAAKTETVPTIPVKPLPRPAAKRKAAPKPVPTQRVWLSAMAGLGTADDSGLVVRGFGVYGGDEDVIVGLRQRFSTGFQDIRHGRETALMVGGLIGSRQRAWWAVGISAFELERRGYRTEDNYYRKKIGLPLELVYAPHWGPAGIELRGEVNLNSAYPQISTGLAFSFGSK